MFNRNNGQVAIDKKSSFCELLKLSPLARKDSISHKLKVWDEIILSKEPQITRGALNNSHGDWYEWILAITAWNMRIKKNSNNHILLLPNISSFDVNRLYIGSIQSIITNLKTKSLKEAGVSFTTSNPDLVFLNSSQKIEDKTIKLASLNSSLLDLLENSYLKFIDKLDIQDLIGFLSVKTSFRPDRRLQIAHEGSVVKAIHAHITRSLRISKPTNLKYFALSTNANEADRNALKTLAAHSIATQDIPLTAAVDDVIVIDSLEAAEEFFDKIIY